MKIVHACYGTPGPHGGGGNVYFQQHIEALSALGHEVHSLIAAPDRPLAPAVERLVASVTYAPPVAPRRSADRLLAALFRAETLPYALKDWRGLASQMAFHIDRLEPDAVWADWIGTLPLLPRDRPTFYGHLDFVYMLKPVRARLDRWRLHRPDFLTTRRIKKIELELCSWLTGVVSASATDLEVFEQLGVPAVYAPVVGEAVPPPTRPPRERAAAFLLGRSNTAMRSSRRQLRDEIWPHFGDSPPQLDWHQVGYPPTNRYDDWEWLEKHFETHGFVDDLGELFAPGDLSLIPYRDDTGFRAKFVTAAAYGLVNLGFRETFAVSTEFASGVNCLAAEDGRHFAELLQEYGADRALRERLAAASRALYEERFTLEGLLPLYAEVLGWLERRPEPEPPSEQ